LLALDSPCGERQLEGNFKKKGKKKKKGGKKRKKKKIFNFKKWDPSRPPVLSV
jgi:hypothetical protein